MGFKVPENPTFQSFYSEMGVDSNAGTKNPVLGSRAISGNFGMVPSNETHFEMFLADSKFFSLCFIYLLYVLIVPEKYFILDLALLSLGSIEF